MSDRVIDLRGEVCPYTFVKTKLQLEEMVQGQILTIIVDYPPAVKNISKSLKLYGEEILSVNQTQEQEWEIVVKKKSDW
ncbi:sulfurtransferase TusA family protein [Zhaonella formicivorans]|uniref:sulfurtransferase TusA family protein n=1 Tax=Zhaonella formicivorans TaxID=2528593 RepID=UPI0010D24E71|nr:sulfurtransferase TusA family protein [Zhaonella formicivorans]